MVLLAVLLRGHKLEADTEPILETEPEPSREGVEGEPVAHDKGKDQGAAQGAGPREAKSESHEDDSGEFIGEPVEKERKQEEIPEPTQASSNVPKEAVKPVFPAEPPLICEHIVPRG